MGKKSFRVRERSTRWQRWPRRCASHGGWRDYAPFDKNNDKLEEYYNALLQLPEEEKQQYWEALRRELPNSFRFTGSKG
ncbi:tRNA (cytosine-5-)-methyltransferase ncl1 [Metarhizium acridum]|nr:tRNA (cytosine-5-)-methyltransferase ncl1 [Metarhizium acridum]